MIISSRPSRRTRWRFCAGALVLLAAPLAGQGVTVSGKLTVFDRGDRPAEDVGAAVVWLESIDAPAATPAAATMMTQDKQFLPHVLVIPVGSAVTFPNNDGFNHNVFSLSSAGKFDLGLYDRGAGKTQQFSTAGIIRVYCNVHATMGGFIVVEDNPYYAQPTGDGGFSIADVLPGEYTLRAWHERAKPLERTLKVTAAGVRGLTLELDARGYSYKPHLNKYGQPYQAGGRRY